MGLLEYALVWLEEKYSDVHKIGHPIHITADTLLCSKWAFILNVNYLDILWLFEDNHQHISHKIIVISTCGG